MFGDSEVWPATSHPTRLLLLLRILGAAWGDPQETFLLPNAENAKMLPETKVGRACWRQHPISENTCVFCSLAI
eukprot:2415650-Alexandrium_andersonii.AAC.1